MYIDIELHQNSSDKYSITWECAKQVIKEKEIKMIAGLPSEKIPIREYESDDNEPIKPLVLTRRFNEVKKLESEYL
jgi:hypothetical protein